MSIKDSITALFPGLRDGAWTRTLTKVGFAICGIALAYLLLESNLIPWKPSYQWNIQGLVSDDSTNALSGVSVVATGYVRWTLINLLAGTAPRSFHSQTATDQNGHFALSFTGSTVTLTLEKTGYTEKQFVFHHSAGVSGGPWSATNRDLRIVLDPAH